MGTLEDLPRPILVEILSRLSTSGDLARCRLASRTLRSLSYEVRSVRLLCSYDCFLRSSEPETCHVGVPFKSLVFNLASLLSAGGRLESLSLGTERPFFYGGPISDVSVALHLTATDFVSRWLPLVGKKLRSLSISDYWSQSCWCRSEALPLISVYCDGLMNLELKDAWLSVKQLKPMLKLTTLTLEIINLDDEDLEIVNECMPSLRVLKLIGIGGLKKPKIHLAVLEVCYWTVPFILYLTIIAPKLIKLNLKLVEPKALVLNTPLLSDLDIKIKKPTGNFQLEHSLNLKSLKMESADLHSLTQIFMGTRTVKKLELEAPGFRNSDGLIANFGDLVNAFPSIDELTLRPGAWVDMKNYYAHKGTGDSFEWSLKKLIVCLPLSESDTIFVSFVLSLCTKLCEVIVLTHADESEATGEHIVFSYSCNFPKVLWKRGTWKESSGDRFSVIAEKYLSCFEY